MLKTVRLVSSLKLSTFSWSSVSEIYSKEVSTALPGINIPNIFEDVEINSINIYLTLYVVQKIIEIFSFQMNELIKLRQTVQDQK